MMSLRPAKLVTAAITFIALHAVGFGAQDVELSIKPNANGIASLFFESGVDSASTFVISNAAASSSVLNFKNGAFPQEVLKIEGVKKVAAADVAPTAAKAAEAVATAAALLETQHATRKSFLRSQDSAPAIQQAASAATTATPTKSTPAAGAESLKVGVGSLSNRGGSISLSPSGSFSVGGHEQWKLISDEAFGKGTIEGWTSAQPGSASESPVSEASTCARRPHAESDYFLGTFGNMRVKKSFTLPPHQYLRITGRVHFLDAWDGGRCSMKVDGALKWAKQHTACHLFPSKACQPGPGSGTLDACADPNFSDTLSEPLDIAWKHDKGSIEVEFRGHLSNGRSCTTDASCDDGFTCAAGTCVNNKASWGVDDFRIYVR